VNVTFHILQCFDVYQVSVMLTSDSSSNAVCCDITAGDCIIIHGR